MRLRLPGDACQPSFPQLGKNLGREDGGRNSGLSGAPAPPQQKTGSAQQCGRHKALMHNTAGELFPSNEGRRSWRTRALLNSGVAGADRTGVEISATGVHVAGQRRICSPYGMIPLAWGAEAIEA